MNTEYPVTLEEFKLYFLREAGLEYQPYANYDPEKQYAAGDKVVAVVKYQPGIWVALQDTVGVEPGFDEEVWQEDEDEVLDDCILDADILRAMGEAVFKFNKCLFSKEKGKIIFLYLAMFFLVYDRQMAAAGMNGNSASGPVIHRTVGKMTVTYMESKLYAKYPSYEFLSSNDYGRKAFNLMAPYLRGGLQILRGGSTGE